MIGQAESLPVRQDMVTLLTFVRDHKVVGTQTTGNMPLKMVREVTARFVNPPSLETVIGDHVYQLRSEADLWPLYFLHILAEVARMIKTGQARRWQLTTHGKTFLEMDPLRQVSYLLTVWWYQVNWVVAFPVSGLGDAMPPGFSRITLAQLRSLDVGRVINFERFADVLIEKTGLTWGANESPYATSSMRSAIYRTVIAILIKFGALKGTYRHEPLGNSTISHLDTFEVTPFGRAILDGVAIMSG
jgi:hypothetical protein